MKNRWFVSGRLEAHGFYPESPRHTLITTARTKKDAKRYAKKAREKGWLDVKVERIVWVTYRHQGSFGL